MCSRDTLATLKSSLAQSRNFLLFGRKEKKIGMIGLGQINFVTVNSVLLLNKAFTVPTYSFKAVTANCLADVTVGESQLSVETLSTGAGAVLMGSAGLTIVGWLRIRKAPQKHNLVAGRE